MIIDCHELRQYKITVTPAVNCEARLKLLLTQNHLVTLYDLSIPATLPGRYRFLTVHNNSQNDVVNSTSKIISKVTSISEILYSWLIPHRGTHQLLPQLLQ